MPDPEDTRPRVRAVPGGDTLNHDGPPVTPRVAAGVILVRGGDETLELLMVRRTPQARFMGGVWVFPGGALDAADGDGEAGLRSAAIRELVEETTVVLPDDAELVAFSRWITPEPLPIRFDTVFFVSHAPDDAQPAVDGHEMVDWRWISPTGALAAAKADEMEVAFPTRHDLEGLAAHASAAELIEQSRERPVFPTQPVVVVGDDGTPSVIIPPRPDGAP
jgi:8-oxo-dGTP pyrophosphatase MutT (NUDIX family)